MGIVTNGRSSHRACTNVSAGALCQGPLLLGIDCLILDCVKVWFPMMEPFMKDQMCD